MQILPATRKGARLGHHSDAKSYSSEGVSLFNKGLCPLTIPTKYFFFR